jgi:hypothetical protein
MNDMSGSIVYILYFLTFFAMYLLIGLLIMNYKKKGQKRDKWLMIWDALGWVFLVFL